MTCFKLFFVVALLVAQVLSVPTSKSFTADIDVVEKDGSVGKVTWNYDARQNAESLIFHRGAGKVTTNVRLFAHKMEYLVIDDTCYALPLSEKSIPAPSARIADMSSNKAVLRWTSTIEGPVAADLFAIPAACMTSNNVEDGLFCEPCLTVGGSVINLGCNATAAEISTLCGDVFASVCKAVLVKACSGVCEIEECAADVCCLFDLCSGDTCNSSNSTSGVQESFDSVESSTEVGDGIFCPTCLTVSKEVVNLGCNATSTEISNLCGSLFEEVCKAVLETACSGVCTVEQCAVQSCCLFKLCSGDTCNSTLTAVPSTHVSGLVELNLNM